MIQELSREISTVIQAASQFIVLIQGRRSPSSGIVWGKNLIVTADHSIPRIEELRVQIENGDTITATVAGRDPSTDIALLKTGRDLSPIPAGGDPIAKTGEFGIVLGRANGGRLIAVFSMISGADGSYKNWRGGTFDQFLRLDVSPFPGFSGSVLLNSQGQAVGMNTAIFSRHFGLTVPASNIQRLVERLSEKGSIGRPYIGLMMQPVRLPDALRNEAKSEIGLLVVGTEKGSPAEQSGLFLGDIVVALNEKTINSIEELHALLSSETIGKEIKVNFLRGGKLHQQAVTVGQRPGRH